LHNNAPLMNSFVTTIAASMLYGDVTVITIVVIGRTRPIVQTAISNVTKEDAFQTAGGAMEVVIVRMEVTK